ncbi:MAG: serpin family protein [Prolixibacteraceae bacterium]
MENRYLFIFILSLLLLFSSCDENFTSPKEIKLDLKSKELIEMDNSFGIDLFQRLSQKEEGNFTISPLSISLALAMTYNGAREETKMAMEKAMHLHGLSPQEINSSYQSLVKALLEADPKVQLDIAQSIWYRMGFKVQEDFKLINQTYYDAEVNELDFDRPDALAIINGWIADRTHDKITDMIDFIMPTHVMFLINAIYFNGEWKTKFDTSDTQKQNFITENDSIFEVDMMSKTDSVNFQNNELFSSIELPYGRGNFNMVVLLPNDGVTCDQITAELSPENWKKWMSAYAMTKDLSIYLPKFKTAFEIKLNDILSDMGMGIAFHDGANFEGINTDLDIYIDYVQHNTFIDVSEKGTEAAAATVVAMTWKMAPLTFNVNKPFIYAITEKETGAILFIGKIVEPSYN